MAWQDRDYYRDDPPTGISGGASGGGVSMVTLLLIINCAVFVLDAVLTNSARASRLSPGYWGAFSLERAVNRLELWRWVTYQFIHADFFHILFNMIGLYFFGRLMERWWGSRRFLAFYLLCGTVGAVVFALLSQLPGLLHVRPSTTLVGASGSVFGILVGCAVVFPHQRVMLLFPPIPMTMRTLALIFLGIAGLSVLVGSVNAGGEAAHLGGAALGFVLIRYPRLLGFAEASPPTAGRRGRWEKQMVKQEQARLAQQAEVDRILAKVKEQGLHSLTSREKKTLQRATDERREAG